MDDATRRPPIVLFKVLPVSWLFLPIIASCALLQPGCLYAQSVKETRDQAFQRARSEVEKKHYDTALETFRRLAAQNPRDFEARTWAARLQSFRGDFLEAAQSYRSVLSDDPHNLEAELGLVDVLSWQKHYPEAMERLAKLRDREPNNTEILLRLAKLSRWRHRRADASRYYQEVLRIAPTNLEARQAVDLLSVEKPFRIEWGYFVEDFDFAGNTNGTFAEILYRDYHRLTMLGRIQYQNKFQQGNVGLAVGATYKCWERTWLRGEFSGSPSGGKVTPSQDYTLEATQGVNSYLAVGGGYRIMKFQGANVQVITGLINLDPRHDFHLYLRYTPARTRFDQPERSVWNHGGWARLVWDVKPSFSPYVLFAVGAEHTTLSIDQLGRFAAQTYGGGTEIRFSQKQGFRLGYYYQHRTQGHREQSLGVSYFVSF